MMPAELLGTLPGWITSAGVLTMLGLLLRWQILNRKLGIDRRVAENTAEIGVGNLYAAEVQALRTRLDSQSQRFSAALDEIEKRHRDALSEVDRNHREAMAASEKRHEECLADREHLRGEVNVLRNEINGMVRVITQASIDRVVMLGDVVPNDIKDSAARAQILIDKEADKK